MAGLLWTFALFQVLKLWLLFGDLWSFISLNLIGLDGGAMAAWFSYACELLLPSSRLLTPSSLRKFHSTCILLLVPVGVSLGLFFELPKLREALQGSIGKPNLLNLRGSKDKLMRLVQGDCWMMQFEEAFTNALKIAKPTTTTTSTTRFSPSSPPPLYISGLFGSLLASHATMRFSRLFSMHVRGALIFTRGGSMEINVYIFIFIRILFGFVIGFTVQICNLKKYNNNNNLTFSS
ncbi:hypothetical protein IEQ34_013697 [Dendrobium chrysotoxum]|uniref:Uncharacterized protein n=1 Tax=Dendrobium chrysotoxum TaxID=161865 RepID=A0AAV7GPX0_DENCH|nr:hypothetical protein IEQ34_013697 [Dendrobium chrysotoxum]